MSRVIDLSAQRRGGGPSEPLRHPAGVTLPFDGPSDAALIIPEIRSEIRSGAYDSDMIALFDAALSPGDRVLVIGAGIGVLSTLIARHEEVERVIAVEANTALIPYLERTHALNDVERVETVNAVLAEGKKGRVPFFARRDLRTSSLLPHDRSWQQVMMVPFMDLNLILAEERISLIVSDIPAASAELLARAELGQVERILLSCADDPAGAWEDGGVCALLVERGYVPEAAGTAVLFRRADVLEKPGAKAAAGTDAREAARDAAAEGTGPDKGTGGKAPEGEDIGEDTDEDDTDESVARGKETGGPGDGEKPAGGMATAAAGPVRRRRRRRRGGAADEAREAHAPQEASLQEASSTGNGCVWRRGRLWGLVAVALFLALPLMLIGHLAGERGAARMQELEHIGTTWGGPQTLTGPFLLVPVHGADGSAAEPLVVLPDTLEMTTQLETDGTRSDAVPGTTPAALVYRSRSEIRLAADAAAASLLLGPGEMALWDDTLIGLGVSEPAALGAAYLLGSQPRQAGFAPGSGAAGVPGIHASIGDPRGRDQAWRFVLELDGWRTLRLTPAGRLSTWRLNGDWPHPAFVGAFRPALDETGARGFVAEWQVPEAAHALPRAFRGTGPLARLEAAALGVSLAQPFDLYRTVERAAKLGLLVIVLTFGAALLVEQAAGREGRLAHYALIGAAQCAFFLLLLPLAEWIGFAVAYALAAAATTALLTAYAWSALRLGARAGWMALALAVLYAAIYPILVSDEHTLLMVALLAFLVVGALMWVTRGANGRSPRPKNSA